MVSRAHLVHECLLVHQMCFKDVAEIEAVGAQQ
jgi:hypothetical protein